jgi:nucleotide-binding universal stress UspA family protein
MSYRRLLSVLDGAASDRVCLQAARSCAEASGGHVDALHVRLDPRSYVDFTGDAMTGDAYAELLDSLEQDVAASAKRARAAFDDWIGNDGISLSNSPGSAAGMTASWREETGVAEHLVAREGRLADIIVMPNAVDTEDSRRERTIERAIFDSGRPLLLVPGGRDFKPVRHAVILWNASAQSARAVDGAIPLLHQAKTVDVMWVEEEVEEDGVQTGLPGYLAWHGIDASTVRLKPDDRLMGELLLEEAEKRGADLVAMGAYTHSRLREFVLGGVTQHILENAAVSVLLAH